MIRVLQIAMVSFVLSLVLGLQQCSHEDEAEQKQNITDENKNKIAPILEKNKEETNVKKKEKQTATKEKKPEKVFSHVEKRVEQNFTNSDPNTSRELNITDKETETNTKEQSVSKTEDNENIVMQSLISDIVKEEANNTQQDKNQLSQISVIQTEENRTDENKTTMEVSTEKTANTDNNDSYAIKVYFTEPKPNPLEKKLAEAKEELNATQAKYEVLLFAKESLENNLTQEQQKEQELLNENEVLKEQIEILEVKTNKETNATKNELELLRAQMEKMNSNLNSTQSRYDLLQQQEKQEKSALQILLASKESLENSLTQEQQKKQELLGKNKMLKERAKASEELNTTKAILQQLQKKYKQEHKLFNEVMLSKDSLEGNLTQTRGEHKKLLQENNTLKIELKKFKNTAKQMAILKKELNATKATYEKVLKEEKNKESVLAQKEQTCGTKLSELILAIKAIKEEKNTQMQGLLSGKQTLKDEFTALKERYDALKKEDDKLQQRLQDEQQVSNQMVQKLQSELEQAQKKIEAIEMQKAQRATIEKKKEELFDQFKLAKVAFKNDSAELTYDSKKRLDDVAETMKKYNHFRYKVQGHTDGAGNPKYNLKLSKMRAKSVKEYLIGQDVDESILSFEGYGSSVPIASNKTKKGRLKNRRVVFEIIQP